MYESGPAQPYCILSLPQVKRNFSVLDTLQHVYLITIIRTAKYVWIKQYIIIPSSFIPLFGQACHLQLIVFFHCDLKLFHNLKAEFTFLIKVLMRVVFLSFAFLFWKTGTPKSQISHYKVCEWSGPCTGIYQKLIWNSCTGCIVNLDSEKLNVKTHFNKMYIECCLLRKFTIYTVFLMAKEFTLLEDVNLHIWQKKYY